MTTSAIEHPKVVSRAEWLAARKELLAEEKALTRARDALSAKRRELPWVKVDKEYVFDTPNGKKTLADLFDGCSQLIVYHFMWRREFGEGCVGCSFLADHVDGPNQHLAQHDVTFVAVSRAPLPVLEAFKKRMGWRFNWVSSFESDFNFDYHVSFTPKELATGKVFYNYRTADASIEELAGMSVFYKDADGNVFANPKSRILVCPLLVTKMFAGLMSRWTIPFAWAASSASAISIPRSSMRSNSIRGPSIRSRRVLPSRYSITRKSRPWCSPIS